MVLRTDLLDDGRAFGGLRGVHKSRSLRSVHQGTVEEMVPTTALVEID